MRKRYERRLEFYRVGLGLRPTKINGNAESQRKPPSGPGLGAEGGLQSLVRFSRLTPAAKNAVRYASEIAPASSEIAISYLGLAMKCWRWTLYPAASRADAMSSAYADDSGSENVDIPTVVAVGFRSATSWANLLGSIRRQANACLRRSVSDLASAASFSRTAARSCAFVTSSSPCETICNWGIIHTFGYDKRRHALLKKMGITGSSRS
jgi:hypothetical protein